MGLVDLLAPGRCLACSARAAPPWCEACAEKAASLAVAGACDRCGGAGAPGGPHRRAADDGHPCWPITVPILSTVVAYRYTGAVARTVAAAKARAAWAGWDVLGERLADAVEAASVVGVDAVTWVPASDRRVRQRGADHAALLAGPVSRRLRRPLVTLLVTGGRRADQARLPTAARRALATDAFAARCALDGARILLVDDVLTTGATARAAAGALVRAGARPVRLAVLARAGGHRLGDGA